MKKEFVRTLLGMLLCIWGLSSCSKLTHCEKGSRTDYIFELPAKLYPAKDTFAIGDTIWIEQEFSDNMLNLNYKKNKYYTLENFDFKTVLSILDLNSPAPATTYTNPIIVDYKGSTDFNYGSSVPAQALYLKYDYTNNVYSYKAAFIIERPGFYCFGFSSNTYAEKVDITECKDEDMRIHYKLNGDDDDNFEMLHFSKDPYYHDYTLERFKEEGDYCFYVK